MLKTKATEQVNWGFLLLFHWCRNQGKIWNKKRVYRVYKLENLHLRKPKARKKIKRVAINPLPAEQINEVEPPMRMVNGFFERYISE